MFHCNVIFFKGKHDQQGRNASDIIKEDENGPKKKYSKVEGNNIWLYVICILREYEYTVVLWRFRPFTMPFLTIRPNCQHKC